MTQVRNPKAAFLQKTSAGRLSGRSSEDSGSLLKKSLGGHVRGAAKQNVTKGMLFAEVVSATLTKYRQ